MAGSKNVTDFLGIKPEYGAMGSQDIADTAKEFAAVTAGNALTANAGLKAQADIAAAQHYADAGVAAGAAAGQASMVGGIVGGLGGLAGGFSKAGGGGGLSPAMQQASISGGLNLGSSLAGMFK
jgi:hypothetical protein